MDYKDLNVSKLWKYITNLLDNVTCINCCKYFVSPTIASCGHSLCGACYIGRRNCPYCALLIDKKALRLNVPLQAQTEHTIKLRQTFVSLFNKHLDDFMLETDTQQHINEWLANSENQFSAPVTSSQPFTEEIVKPVQKITSEIQIHSKSKKVEDLKRETIKMNINQEDWDKIEEMPETETNKSTENPVGPMDIETFDVFIDEKDYSTNNPRRSSRNKLLKISKPSYTNPLHKKSDNMLKINSDKTKEIAKDLKIIKKPTKKFSNMNKKIRSKLNVSIEMCKKANVAAKIGDQSNSQQLSYKIDSNTPEITKEPLTKNTDFHNDNDSQKDTANVKNLPISTTNTKNNISNKVQNNSSLTNFQDLNRTSLDVQTKTKENNLQINQNGSLPKVSFFKRGPLEDTIDANNTHIIKVDNPIAKNQTTDRINTDDIEITIKIGNLAASICIQKKENDMQLKINTDRQIQTSLGDCMEYDHNMRSLENDPNTHQIVTAATNNVVKSHKDVSTQYEISNVQTDKSQSTKKNTSSADTSTAHIDITESEEREFADNMDNTSLFKNQDNSESNKISKSDCTVKHNKSENVTFINKEDKSTHNLPEYGTSSKSNFSSKNMETIRKEVEFLNEMDIFDGESVKGCNIQALTSTKNIPSAILKPTIKSKSISQKKSNKRGPDTCNTDLSNNKKIKLSKESIEDHRKHQDSILKENIIFEDESENIAYDAIMSQVFANINAEMDLQKTGTDTRMQTQISNTQKSNIENFVKPIKNHLNEEINGKCSENIFSLLEKEDGNSVTFKTTCHKSFGQTQNLKDKSEKEPTLPMQNNNLVEFGTPIQDDDDDKSVVEETPQKKTSFIKNKNKNESKTSPDNALVPQCTSTIKDTSLTDVRNPQKDKRTEDSENITISNSPAEIRRSTLETPLTIKSFVDEVTHKSTPLARKSLNFDRREAENDLEETICPSSVVAAKTTQEREFMSKAFEETLESPSQTFCAGGQRGRVARLCVAGSCLMASEQVMLKDLCARRSWIYVDKFTQDLTHLVVGVDEENKAQRSVKFICALASSKWIVSFAWVEKCILLKGYADEEPFEALDATGEPGPRRSRLAKAKLLQGLSFYCLPPFTVIDITTLKQDILEAAGGRVETERRAVQARPVPAILLAEPENTQEDRFIYLAMELKIVPVNYEWVLDCIGTYTLKPIFDLLLCPASLLPPGVSCWPPELISPNDE